nr:hypothetical protein [Tanacetum cinerariifolium]
PEWSKFVTDVKLVRDLHDTSSTVNHNAYMASTPQIEYAPIAHHPSELSSPETGLVIPVFQKGDDLILSVIEQLKTQVVNCTKINQDNKQVNELLTDEIE